MIDDSAALQDILTDYAQYYEREYRNMMGRKLGVRLAEEESSDALLAQLDTVLQLHETDMTLFYRLLCDYRPGQALSECVKAAFYHPESVSAETINKMNAWGESLALLIDSQKQDPNLRKTQMQAVNPCYVL